jgi:hypothetical protein
LRREEGSGEAKLEPVVLICRWVNMPYIYPSISTHITKKDIAEKLARTVGGLFVAST